MHAYMQKTQYVHIRSIIYYQTRQYRGKYAIVKFYKQFFKCLFTLRTHVVSLTLSSVSQHIAACHAEHESERHTSVAN